MRLLQKVATMAQLMPLSPFKKPRLPQPRTLTTIINSNYKLKTNSQSEKNEEREKHSINIKQRKKMYTVVCILPQRLKTKISEQKISHNYTQISLTF